MSRPTPQIEVAIAHGDTGVRIDPRYVVFSQRNVISGAGSAIFHLFVPSYWNIRRKWPVILFLHGEDDQPGCGEISPLLGVRTLLSLLGTDFPCLIVCPQCAPGKDWNHPVMQKLALTALDQAVHECNGDISRVYLTGMSMGGAGVWELATRWPSRWAAIVPVCGGVPASSTASASAVEGGVDIRDPYTALASRLRFVPIWVFHGTSDTAVPISEPRQLVAALHALEADVRFTEYDGRGHESWSLAYSEADLLKWLLLYRTPHNRAFKTKRPYRRRR